LLYSSPFVFVGVCVLDDGRQEQINYDERFVYPNENEEFCFEEVQTPFSI
jgi:hypothetical protein